jgi:hypothetical protein
MTESPSTLLDLTQEKDRQEYLVLLLFLAYLDDRGISAHMIRQIAIDLYKDAVPSERLGENSDATKIYEKALNDIRNTGTEITLTDVILMVAEFGSALMDRTSDDIEATKGEVTKPRVPTYDLTQVASNAASLEFLYDYARLLSPTVFPPHAIPSRQFVDRCLTLFHQIKLDEVEKAVAAEMGDDDSVAGSDMQFFETNEPDC